jgi:predicted nucleic acid-binding Zn ribbon protein
MRFSFFYLLSGPQIENIRFILPQKKKLFFSEKEKINFRLLHKKSPVWNFVLKKNNVMGYENMLEQRAHCLECGEEIVYGRSDKKFCSDECRSHHHNRHHRSGRYYRRMVTSILDRNYEILDDLVSNGVQAIWVADAIAMGFNPAYVTSYRKHGKRTMCHCYDISYITTDNRMTSISKIQNLSVTLQAADKRP